MARDDKRSQLRDQLIKTVEDLTVEKLGPRSALYDQEATHPKENWQDLFGQGLLAMSVPEEYGGMGLDPLSYVMVLEEIAKGCSSTSMTLHMHSTVIRFIAATATAQQKARFYPEVVDGGKMFGSWGSEPNTSLGRNFFMETSAEQADGGYLINGVKHFCTMAGAASFMQVFCSLGGSDDMANNSMLILVPADSPGLNITGEWNTLGMRGTVSPSVEFTDCFVEESYVLGKPGEFLKVGVVESFPLGYAAVYLGTAAAALDFTTEFCKTRIFKPDTVPISNDPIIQRHLGDLSIHLDAARAVLYQSASQWEQADATTRGLLAAKAKYLCSEAALETTSRAIQIVGGRSAHKNMPLERAFRDVRTSTLMPPNADVMLANIGKGNLGLLGAMFRVDGSPEL